MTVNAVQMNLNAEVEYEPENDIVTSLLDIVTMYRNHELLLPPHQRDFVWSDEKKRGWIERIQRQSVGVRPVGVFLTYQVANGHASPIFLNDGSQRVRATVEYLDIPEKYGDTAQRALDVVRRCQMPKQHRHYKTHEEAMVDFQLLNLGTTLTPFELCSGILQYMPRQTDAWKKALASLHQTVNVAAQRLGCKPPSGRENSHRYLRHDYGLLYRFLTQDQQLTCYHVAVSHETWERVAKKQVIEWRLRMLFEQMALKDVEAELDKFRQMVNRETVQIIDVWNRVKREQGIDPNAAIYVNTYRWLLECAIWKRNTGTPANKWDDFLAKVLSNGGGAPQLIDLAKPRDKVFLGLDGFRRLSEACKYIKSDFYDREARARKKTKLHRQSPPGYDVSHVLPLSSNGDGDVFLEPAARNRARGARPVDQPEDAA